MDASVTIPGFRIVRPLGKGGMGQVFEATNLQTGRRVALKVALTGSGDDEALVRRLEREAEILRELYSSYLPGFVAWVPGPPAALAMEFIEGTPLDRVLRDEATRTGRLKVLARVLPGVCHGLAALHAKGGVHRDIKPENIIVRSEDGKGILLDLGLAKADFAVAYKTATGMLLGTPGYMAPEQFRPGTRFGPETDLFQLATLIARAVDLRPEGSLRDEFARAEDSVSHFAPELAWLRATHPGLAAWVTGGLVADPTGRGVGAHPWEKLVAALQEDPRTPDESRGAPSDRTAVQEVAPAHMASRAGVLPAGRVDLDRRLPRRPKGGRPVWRSPGWLAGFAFLALLGGLDVLPFPGRNAREAAIRDVEQRLAPWIGPSVGGPDPSGGTRIDGSTARLDPADAERALAALSPCLAVEGAPTGCGRALSLSLVAFEAAGFDPRLGALATRLVDGTSTGSGNSRSELDRVALSLARLVEGAWHRSELGGGDDLGYLASVHRVGDRILGSEHPVVRAARATSQYRRGRWDGLETLVTASLSGSVPPHGGPGVSAGLRRILDLALPRILEGDPKAWSEDSGIRALVRLLRRGLTAVGFLVLAAEKEGTTFDRAELASTIRVAVDALDRILGPQAESAGSEGGNAYGRSLVAALRLGLGQSTDEAGHFERVAVRGDREDSPEARTTGLVCPHAGIGGGSARELHLIVDRLCRDAYIEHSQARRTRVLHSEVRTTRISERLERGSEIVSTALTCGIVSGVVRGMWPSADLFRCASLLALDGLEEFQENTTIAALCATRPAAWDSLEDSAGGSASEITYLLTRIQDLSCAERSDLNLAMTRLYDSLASQDPVRLLLQSRGDRITASPQEATSWRALFSWATALPEHWTSLPIGEQWKATAVLAYLQEFLKVPGPRLDLTRLSQLLLAWTGREHPGVDAKSLSWRTLKARVALLASLSLESAPGGSDLRARLTWILEDGDLSDLWPLAREYLGRLG